jgi:hypothetical protein
MMSPKELDEYLKVISKHSIVRLLIDKLITPENIKAAISGATEGAIKAKTSGGNNG